MPIQCNNNAIQCRFNAITMPCNANSMPIQCNANAVQCARGRFHMRNRTRSHVNAFSFACEAERVRM
eukprot:11170302-Lingulodinium_polyedra.AAC.1